MDDILSQLAERLGILPGQAATGAGALLNLIRENASRVDFEQLLKAVPEASSWMGTAATAAAQGGAAAGGGLVGGVAGLIGGLAGAAGGLLSALAQSGLGPETATRLVPELLGLLRERADPELIQRLAGSVPFLKDILAGLQLPDGLGGLGKIFG
jgi:hypothetical protein